MLTNRDVSIYFSKMASKDSSSSIPLSSQELVQAAECLRALAHPHRLQIIMMLQHGAFTVGELAQACGIPSHMASEHLRFMRDKGFLDFEKKGRKAYYYIVDPGLESIISCVQKRFGPESEATS